MTQELPKLYSYWRSSSSYRVRIVLAIHGIDYEYIPVNLLKSEQLEDSYANSTNSMKQVPALVDNGKTITQSLVIIRYIEEVLAKKLNFSPIGGNRYNFLKKSFEADEIAEVINSGIQPVQNFAVLKQIANLGGDKAEWGRNTIRNGFVQIEKLVKKSGGRFCVGNEISVADVCLVPQVYNAKRFGVDMSEFPVIAKIEKNLTDLDCFKKAHPDNMVDAVQA